jgi:hypothetical protein
MKKNGRIDKKYLFISEKAEVVNFGLMSGFSGGKLKI